MNHACPYCQRNLSKVRLRRRAPPGARRWLPAITLAVCPSCDGLLQRNLHPSEISAYLIAAAALCLAVVLRDPFAQWCESLMHGSGKYATIGWVFLLGGFGLWREHSATQNIPTDWPIYKVWAAPHKR